MVAGTAGGVVGTCWALDIDKSDETYTTGSTSAGVRKLEIININVTKGSTAANVRVLNDSGDRSNYVGGFIGSSHNTCIILSHNRLVGVNVSAKDDEGVDYSVSRADNYVIYTNAKIIPDYVE